MLHCRVNLPPIFDCVQWLGSNKDEIAEFVDGKVGASPFSQTQLTVKGGDSYQIIHLSDWLLRDREGNFTVIDDSTFKDYYEVVEA